MIRLRPKRPKFASFFSGVGMFDLGFVRAGWEPVFACEIGEFPRRVYEERFGRRMEAEDINKVEEVPDAKAWIGGFPCQDISSAGKRKGIGASRSGLVWRFLELWDHHPEVEWLVLENVRGLLTGRSPRTHEAGRDLGETAEDSSWMGQLLGALADRGLRWAYRLLDAQYFGVPQSRPRVFIVARRSGVGPGPREILFDRDDRSSAPPKQVGAKLPPGVAYCLNTLAPWAQTGYTPFTVIREAAGDSRCLSAKNPRDQFSDRVTFVGEDSGRLRFLTPVECERLQGLPDDWTNIEGATDEKRYHAIGNGGAVPVLEWIARRIREVEFGLR